jgi:hypothetical protein
VPVELTLAPVVPAMRPLLSLHESSRTSAHEQAGTRARTTLQIAS